MKKFISITLGAVIAFLISSPAVLAAEAESPSPQNDRVKVYLSEPLGAGIPVHVITRCLKTRQKAPLKCDANNSEVFQEQCKKTEGNPSKTRTLYGKNIERCENGDKNQDQLTRADIDESGNKCKQEDSNFINRTRYGYVWAIKYCPQRAEEEEWRGCVKPEDFEYKYVTYVDYVAINGGDQLPPPDFRLGGGKEISDLPGADILPVYGIEKGNCSTVEYTADGKTRLNRLSNKIFGNNSPPPSCVEPPKDVIEQCKSVDLELVGPLLQIGDCSWSCKSGELISGKSGTDLIARYIATVYKWASRVVGIIAVLIMVYSGIEISMSGSQADKIEAAKKRIFMSIAGLAILFLASVILYTINPNFFV